jgi:hypothetical protein
MMLEYHQIRIEERVETQNLASLHNVSPIEYRRPNSVSRFGALRDVTGICRMCIPLHR